MFKIIIIATLIFSIAPVSTALAQTVILEQENLLDTMNSSFGPNRKHFVQLTYGMNFLFGPEEDGAELKHFASHSFQVGLRYKRKLSSTFAVGAEVHSMHSRYSIQQNEDKKVGTLRIHNTEFFNTTHIMMDVFFRINFDPGRGDFLGFFMDIGGGGGYLLSSGYQYRDKLPGGEIREVKYSKLPIFQNFSYHALARIGYTGFSVNFFYRFSDIFVDGEQQRIESVERNVLPDLPRMGVGLELAVP
ncbi:MAG: hypothetical protein WD077_10530 [Bacteroidia bacterium]